MTVDDSIKCRFMNSGVTDQVGGFQNPGVCLQAFPSFLPHPLPALLLAPLFSRSLTLVPRSFLLNRTETLATQAILFTILPDRDLFGSDVGQDWLYTVFAMVFLPWFCIITYVNDRNYWYTPTDFNAEFVIGKRNWKIENAERRLTNLTNLPVYGWPVAA